mgnify:FL=1
MKKSKSYSHIPHEDDIVYSKSFVPDVQVYKEIECQNCYTTYENNNKFPVMYIVSRKNKKFVWWHIDPGSGRKHNL